MRRLRRIFGLATALGLAGFAAASAWPHGYDVCYYYCSATGLQYGYMTYSECCSGDGSTFFCPLVGETASPATSWGGANYPQEYCW